MTRVTSPMTSVIVDYMMITSAHSIARSHTKKYLKSYTSSRILALTWSSMTYSMSAQDFVTDKTIDMRLNTLSPVYGKNVNVPGSQRRKNNLYLCIIKE